MTWLEASSATVPEATTVLDVNQMSTNALITLAAIVERVRMASTNSFANANLAMKANVVSTKSITASPTLANMEGSVGPISTPILVSAQRDTPAKTVKPILTTANSNLVAMAALVLITSMTSNVFVSHHLPAKLVK